MIPPRWRGSARVAAGPRAPRACSRRSSGRAMRIVRTASAAGLRMPPPMEAQVKMAPPRRPESLAGRARRAFAEALPRSIIVRRGPDHAKEVALTFDDGPHELTDAYLDVLDH